MWRSLVSPLLHKQVGILRKSSGGYCTSRFYFTSVTGNGNEDRLTHAEACKKFPGAIIIDSHTASTISRAENAIAHLVRHLMNGCTNKQLKTESSLIHLLLDRVTGIQQDGTVQKDLTICMPNNKWNEEEPGFGFRHVYLGIEKWCYGIVVVSSLISWHRLIFNDEASRNDVFHLLYHDIPALCTPHILPVNGPAKPVDPVDAALSSFESTINECTAVTQNALAIRLSTLNFHEKAVAYFKSASKKGHVAAHFNLGVCYEEGIGTTRNIAKAISSYRIAAAEGHLEAMFNIGRIYLAGKSIRDKNSEGLQLIEKAAEEGLIQAQKFLGLYYADKTTEHYNLNKSVKWLQMAADQNDPTAQYHLGICYERGFCVARNMRQAKTLYKEAAEGGHAGAQFNYAMFHEYGLGGLSVDKSEALRWYNLASDNGNTNAKQNLQHLQRELRDVEKSKGTPSLLQMLRPDIWSVQEPSAAASILPRCASSPDRLHMTTELDTSQEYSQDRMPTRTFEDKKCIWVV